MRPWSPIRLAPTRGLPEYDNVLWPRRPHEGEPRPAPDPPGDGAALGTLLVDGLYRATWAVTRDGAGTATLTVRSFTPLSATDADAVTDEAARLLAFVAPDGGRADRHIRIVAPPT